MSGDLAASIRARLLNKAKALGVPFDEMLRRYAIERLLFRLGQSEFKDRFILKGAQLMRVWSESAFRPTMDMDLLGRIDNDLDVIKGVALHFSTFRNPGFRATRLRACLLRSLKPW